MIEVFRLQGKNCSSHKSLSIAAPHLVAYRSIVCLLFLLVAVLAPQGLLASDSASRPPANLKCEAMREPLGIDVQEPRLSWQLQDNRRGARQTSYQIRVATSEGELKQNNSLTWDSGRVTSNDSVNVVYGGPPVVSRRRYYWQVRVWDQDEKVTEYSTPSWWEMGLLAATDWKAKWITGDNPMEQVAYESNAKWIWAADEQGLSKAKPGKHQFRFQFSIAQPPKAATLLIAAKDHLKLWLNGKLILDPANPANPDRLRTAWQYSHILSIGAQLQRGTNTLAAEVVVDPQRKDTELSYAGLIAVVRLKKSDGAIERFVSGPAWKTSPDSFTTDWYSASFNDSSWSSAASIAALGEEPLGTPWPTLRPSLLRREFQLSKKVRSARIYSTALGAYQLYLNGKRVGDDILAPGWTDYQKRVVYQVYDVTLLVQQKANAVGAILAGGWYADGLTWHPTHFSFGPPPVRFFAQLEIEYSDGTHESIVTDDSWKTSASAILLSEIYDGEDYDATLEQHGWDQSGFADAGWQTATLAKPSLATLVAQNFQPIRMEKTLPAKIVTNPKPGVYIFDLGQNMVGYEHLRVSGPKGTKIRLRFGEVLKPDGELYTENLRSAAATDSYVLSGKGVEDFEPHFTFHGFRYIEITGFPGTPSKNVVEGVVFHTDAPFSIQFNTGSSMVNQLWSNILWGQRGNFLSVPTDCPQRDERLGWMGDAQVFWRTASFNTELAAFSHKFATDMRDAQSSAGAYAVVSPRLPMISEGAAGWADAGVIIPWTAYQQYRDTRILEENWEAMEKWMSYVETHNPNHLWLEARGDDFGDWLAIGSKTPKDLIASAYWGYDASLMQQMAMALGKKSDAQKYQQLFQKIYAAFKEAYVKPDGTVGSGSQTSYVLALHMKLLPDSLRSAAATKLVEDIKTNGGHLTTGFLGTPYLLFELTASGHGDVAYDLLLQNSYPSWGYMIEHGATTMWERWNSDQMLDHPQMNSFNHYAYGAVAEWLYRDVAGIDSEFSDPGFHQILLHPEFGAKLGSVEATYDSLYGPITSSWKVAGNKTTWKAIIPANTTALLYFPSLAGTHVWESGKELSESSDFKFLGNENGNSIYQAGAGAYSFLIEP